jgi:hypothetical protein
MPPSPPDRPPYRRPHRPRRSSPSVSIVIPVRDAAGLPPMLRALPAADELIVVTAAPVPEAVVLAAYPGAVLVRQTRAGLGNALACGVAAGTGDVVVILDGDGATDPGELPRYVDALVAGADVAAGSRYREGGRDLTTGRFRRALNLALVWLLNTLYGVRRTDPGFGYTAFWRDAADRLALPDPSATLPVWGDGPEIEALLAVRAAARGLTVTEVPGVAYPRLRRSSRHNRTTVRHWLRALRTEFRNRTRHPPRHSALPDAEFAQQSNRAVVAPAPNRHSAPSGTDFAQPSTHAITPPRPDRHSVPPGTDFTQPSTHAITPPGPGLRAVPDRRVPPADRRAAGEQGGPAEPIWGPPRRNPEPADLWLADIPAPLDRPAYPAGASGPRTGDVRRDGEDAEEPPREVGTRRRHLEGYRQRPDLRVINGEGTESGLPRSGRLRAVPPREITGGRPGPQ